MAAIVAREKEVIPISEVPIESCRLMMESGGNSLVIGSRDKKVHVVQLSDDLINKPSGILKSYEDFTKRVRDVEYSPNGEMFISVSGENKLRIFSKDGTLCSESVGHSRSITCVALNSSCMKIVTASEDCSFIVWNTQGEQMAVFGKNVDNSHRGWINACGFVPNSADIFLTGSEDGTVKVWNLVDRTLVDTIFKGAYLDYEKAKETGKKIQDYDIDCAVKSMAFSKEGSLLAYGGRDGKVYLMNMNTKELLQVIDVNDKITALTFGDNSPLLAIAVPNKIALWSIVESKQVNSYEFASSGERYCSSLVFIGDEVIAALHNGTLIRIELSRN